jgi:hypothetical protein
MENRKRRAATIKSVSYGLEDHGILTCYIALEYKDGGYQSFGGLELRAEDSGPDFYNSICSLFGVSEIELAVGSKCFALSSFGKLNERIEGLENESGNRFLLTIFAQRYETDVLSPLDREKQRYYNQISFAKERIADAMNNLATLDSEYTDWSKV